jgi:iron complex transport system substrate-binding protein
VRAIVVAVGVALALIGAGRAGWAAPQRVVSINMCADQLLVLLAEPERIASLTNLAADPDLSFVAPQAGRFGVNHGQIEEILADDPDLILAGAYSAEPALAFFRSRRVPIVMVGIPDDFDSIRAEVRAVAAALGSPERGEAAIAGMDRELAEAVRPPSGRRGLAWQPGGFTAGAGTLTDSVLRAAGLGNVAAEAGLTGYGYLSLEAVVAGQPDLLIADARLPNRPSLREALVQHPALNNLRHTKRVEIPGPLMACGGPFTARAVALLSEAMSQ